MQSAFPINCELYLSNAFMHYAYILSDLTRCIFIIINIDVLQFLSRKRLQFYNSFG